MTEELKPCPFCGSADVARLDMMSAQCTKCNAKATLWNRRANSPELPDSSALPEIDWVSVVNGGEIPRIMHEKPHELATAKEILRHVTDSLKRYDAQLRGKK